MLRTNIKEIVGTGKEIKIKIFMTHIYRKAGGSKQERLEGWRQKFLSGLQSEGLEMEDVRAKDEYLLLMMTVSRNIKTKGSSVSTL